MIQNESILLKALQDYIYALKLAVKYLSQPVLWKYLLPALLIALVFFGFYTLYKNILGLVDLFSGIPLIGGVLFRISSWLLDGTYAVGDFMYKFIILTLLSPINCLLSQRTDNEITGARFDGGLGLMIRDFFRAIAVIGISLLMYFTAIVLWWSISGILGLGLIDKIVYFCISAFFIGFSFFDYSLERYRKGIMTTFEFGFRNFESVLISGLIFSLIYLIPFVGLIAAPFLVTIISTMVYLKINNKIKIDQINNIVHQ